MGVVPANKFSVTYIEDVLNKIEQDNVQNKNAYI